MIFSEFNKETGVLVIRPEQMIGLSEADFKYLTDLVDGYLKNHKILHGIVIVAKKFPGWEDLVAFISHFRFILDHHRVIQKVALVSDSPLLSAAPYLVDHFVNAKIRNFSFSGIEQARTWAAEEKRHTGHLITLGGYLDNVVALLAEEVITHSDYEETLIPVTENKIRVHGKVKLLYWCGE